MKIMPFGKFIIFLPLGNYAIWDVILWNVISSESASPATTIGASPNWGLTGSSGSSSASHTKCWSSNASIAWVNFKHRNSFSIFFATFTSCSTLEILALFQFPPFQNNEFYVCFYVFTGTGKEPKFCMAVRNRTIFFEAEQDDFKLHKICLNQNGLSVFFIFWIIRTWPGKIKEFRTPILPHEVWVNDDAPENSCD